VAVDDGVHLALRARADEDDTGRAGRHLPGVGDVGGVELDAEAGRQRDVAELGGGGRKKSRELARDAAHHDQERERQSPGQRGARHPHGEPLNRRPSPPRPAMARRRSPPGRATRRPAMRREHHPDHGSVCTSTDTTDGRSRTIGAQLSPALADTYTCPPEVPKYTPHGSSVSTAIASRSTFT